MGHDISKKSVLVTGSSKGLGRDIALAYASHGFNLVIHGRDKERLAHVRNDVRKYNVDCRVVTGDITDEKTIDALSEAAYEINLDVLINNAAIYLNKSLDEMNMSDFRNVIDTNLIATVALTKSIYGLFKQKFSGLVININSIAGKQPSMSESAYSASKHALKGFMDSFQFESLKFNIPIINVYLGAMNTEMTEGRLNSHKLIDTEDAAECVYNLYRNYSSLRIRELEILRKIY